MAKKEDEELDETEEELDETEEEIEEEVDTSKTSKSLSADHKALVAALVAEQLKPMKDNLDKAFKARDEAVKKATRAEAANKELEQKKLKDEGKHLEAATLKLTELEELLRVKDEALTKLSRDRELESAISGLEFRNDFARETVFKSIVSELTQDDDGDWVHNSGASISDYVKTFAKDPNKDFLFKPKNNSGTGTSTTKGTSKEGRPTSLAGLSTEKLLELASKGLLPEFNY